MRTFYRVDTLANMLDTSDIGDYQGLNELVAHGYEDDMKELYSLTGEHVKLVDAKPANRTVTMGFWTHGRLYEEDTIPAFELKDRPGLWIVEPAYPPPEWFTY